MTLLQPSKGKMGGRLPLIESLEQLPEVIEAELRGLSEEQLRYRPGEGEWCLKEVVGHIRDFAEIDHRRLYMMMTQENPMLPGFDQETLVRAHNHREAGIDAILGELREWRSQTVELLSNLVDASWHRQGRHTEFGRMSIRQFAERRAAHEQMHLAHVRALKEQALKAE